MKALLLISLFLYMGVTTYHVMRDYDRITKMENEVAALKDEIRVLRERDDDYNAIMTTYRFFNEHWTATMKGERE